MLKMNASPGAVIEVTGRGRFRIHVGSDGALGFEDDGEGFEFRRVTMPARPQGGRSGGRSIPRPPRPVGRPRG